MLMATTRQFSDALLDTLREAGYKFELVSEQFVTPSFRLTDLVNTFSWIVT